MALQKKQKPAFYGLALFCAALFLILSLSLYRLQTVESAAMADLSERNSQRLLQLPAPRGEIYSADGLMLATNRLRFVVSVSPVEGQDAKQLAYNLAQVLADPALPASELYQLLINHSRRYEPIEICRYDYEEGLALISRIAENRARLPGVQIGEEPMRYYPQGALAGHLLGTVGAIDAPELEAYAEDGYTATDWLGKTGLEKALECWQTAGGAVSLRGQKGLEQVEVTAGHHKVQTLFKQAAVPGHDVYLTINAGLQQRLEQTLAETIAEVAEEWPKCEAGAAVMLDVKSGAVLAMASYPQLDPNDFAAGLATEKAAYYWDNAASPSLNRAVSALYPPGSVFKGVTALAILEAGIDPTETVRCAPTAWERGNGQARCTGIHGEVDLRQAMAVSCNTYFQELATRAGIEAIARAGRILGFGEKTGIELANESAGTMPDAAFKAANFTGWEQDWHQYDTFFTSIGQGYTTATPLQLASYAATMANNGLRLQPHLVARVEDAQGQTVYEATTQVSGSFDGDPAHFALLREAMLAVTQPGGTGYAAFASFPISVAAKSGTAQTGLPGDAGHNHGSFIAYAPAEAPKVAVACIIEYGQSGGGAAAEVCRELLEAYFFPE